MRLRRTLYSADGLAAAWRLHAALSNFDMFDLHRFEGPVIAWIARHAGNLLNQRDRCGIALTEDGVVSAQVLAMGNVLGNKKLRAVRVWAGIGIGKAAGTVEPQIGRSLILKLVAGIARPVPSRVSALNHEVGNHAVEDCAVIKGNAVHLRV